jgi:OOP family OmpA-OmpF porin
MKSYLVAFAVSAMLIPAAIARDSRIVAPHMSARAQAQFDCWVEQAEEGHQTDHIAVCRTGFLNAMLDVDAALDAWHAQRLEQEYPAK